MWSAWVCFTLSCAYSSKSSTRTFLFLLDIFQILLWIFCEYQAHFNMFNHFYEPKGQFAKILLRTKRNSACNCSLPLSYKSFRLSSDFQELMGQFWPCSWALMICNSIIVINKMYHAEDERSLFKKCFLMLSFVSGFRSWYRQQHIFFLTTIIA